MNHQAISRLLLLVAIQASLSVTWPSITTSTYSTTPPTTTLLPSTWHWTWPPTGPWTSTSTPPHPTTTPLWPTTRPWTSTSTPSHHTTTPPWPTTGPWTSASTPSHYTTTPPWPTTGAWTSKSTSRTSHPTTTPSWPTTGPWTSTSTPSHHTTTPPWPTTRPWTWPITESSVSSSTITPLVLNIEPWTSTPIKLATFFNKTSEQLFTRTSGTTRNQMKNIPDNIYSTSPIGIRWLAVIMSTTTDAYGVESEYFVCAASLLSPSIILSAANCLKDKNIDSLIVRVGDHVENSSTSIKISTVHVHPNFSGQLGDLNNVALLKLSEPLQIDSLESPINFNNVMNKYNSKRCLIMGWKMNHNRGSSSLKPNKVYIHTKSRNRCENWLKIVFSNSTYNLKERFTCAGSKSGIDTCKIDKGGPLVCESLDNSDQYVQVGFASWGSGCGYKALIIFTPLAPNISWLRNEFNILDSDN